MEERAIAFIVARLSSSRLPNKHLRRIGEKRLLDWAIESLKKSSFLDRIVIATVNEDENRPLDEVAREHGIDIFWFDGDINDVVGRLRKAADVFEADIPVLISGDCPLIYAPSLDRLIAKAKDEKKIDFVEFCPKNGRTVIHEGVGVYRKRCWVVADELSKEANLREHHFPIVLLRPDIFKGICVMDEDIFYKLKHRISVDTLADLEFMNEVYNELKGRGKDFDLKNVVELLLEKPEFMEINRDVHQIRIDEKQKKALFVVNSEENLKLFFDLAYEITKKGVGVRFYTENKRLIGEIENRGFGVVDNLNGGEFDFKISENSAP